MKNANARPDTLHLRPKLFRICLPVSIGLLLTLFALYQAGGITAKTGVSETSASGKLDTLTDAPLVSTAFSLGNYPDTTLSLSGNTTVTPDTAPSNTTSINVS